MTNPIHQRIITLLDHLHIDRAHVAARVASDWHGFAASHADRIASLTLTAPTSMPLEGLAPIAPRLIVFASDLVGFGDWITGALHGLPDAKQRLLHHYETPLWADVAVDHCDQIKSALLEQRSLHSVAGVSSADFGAIQGEVNGITYRISGQGEPLLLFPLGLAPSGWTEMIAELSQHFTVILLGGPHLGVMPMLEQRGQSPGYRAMLELLFDRINLQDEESVLEVGFGTGVLLRWLAKRTQGRNPLTGIDLNNYLRAEAQGLAVQDGVADAITLKFGNAEELPFADNTFDVIYSVTVMEEVNAARMIGELVRVVKPGGRVGVIVRAMDIPMKLNLPLPPEDLAPFQQLSPRTEGDSCASTSLYTYFQQAGFADVTFGPYFANFYDAYGQAEQYIVGRYISQLEPAAAARWEAALAQADADGTFVLSWPHHLAVGQKP